MELVHELFATAVLAVMFSFIVAKLVSVAMAGDAAARPEAESGETAGLDRGFGMEEVKFEDRLSARGFEGESRVELVEEAVEEVHRVEAELVASRDAEVEETPTVSGEIEVDRHEVLEKSPVAVEPVEEPLEEEKSGQCCVEEVRQRDDEPFERNSVESAPDQASVAESEEVPEFKSETEEAEDEMTKRDGDGEDDDWEGIERTELEKDFAVAANFAGAGETNYFLESVGSDVMMQLYGLHKVATEGPCHEPQPMALKVSARAKWNAWQRLGNMSPDAAMEKYITLLSENVPGWKEEKCADSNKPDAASPCRDLSTFGNEHLKLGDESNPMANNALDVAESMDNNSENKAKE
ncbi:acyl-CoA-binding domain-containing protein 3-like [Punica granatum]|uniref:Acyl-CoA-binding domain-containing protein 3-like n=2 Tax=Punica granatum TaxID=22663 RepID=A0A6P8EI93_PUNGR|nr:acyl-CoA-binding domain-containing protein 3-like [Punica granatum]PKI42617.1 hypothetical protein CRG98_036999 [Punica granatum]